MVHMEAWLSKVDEIAAEGPSYRLGHDGSDGACDCIGLIIGAIRRAGGKWTGTHSSNWAARNAMDTLHAVTDAGSLQVGQAVFKACATALSYSPLRTVRSLSPGLPPPLLFPSLTKCYK